MAEETAKPKKVDLTDHAAVKRMVDEAVCEVVKHRGYPENMTISNLKLLLGFLACGVALVAQFYPKKYPQNKVVLIICIATYVLLNAAIHLLAYFREKNFILFTYPPKGSFAATGLAVSSKLPKQSDKYTLTVASADEKHIGARPPVEATKSVTKWFSEEGVLVEAFLWEDVQKLLDKYEAEPKKKKSK